MTRPPTKPEGLRRENERLRELLEAARMLFSTLEMNTAIDAILKAAQELTHSSAASIALLDADSGELSLYAQRGLDQYDVIDRRWKPKKGGLTERILTEKRLVIVSQRSHRAFFRDPARVTEAIKALACVPLVFEDRVIGILYVDDFTLREYSDTEQNALTILANFAATAIDRVKLHHVTEQLARTDALTGLANLRHFEEQLAHETLRAGRYRRTLSLLMIDLDDFKHINDSYGHPVGNALLRQAGRTLRSQVREIDLAARYGGEEFAVLLPETDGPHALHVAERIRKALGKIDPVELGIGAKERISVSIGVACFPEDSRDRNELVRLADQALYTAKAKGKNRVVRYGPRT